MDLEEPVTRLELLGTHHAFATTIRLLVDAIGASAPGLRKELLANVSRETNSNRDRPDVISQIAAAVLANVEMALRPD